VSRHLVAEPRTFGLALGLLTIVIITTSTTPAAAGLFDFLFGGFFARPSAPARPSVGSGAVGIGPAAYCVRLCDGRYFPVRSGSASKAVCDGLCPAAQTKVFYGSEIAQATASDGSTYQKLANAFAYRERIVPDCSCNGRDSFGTASMKIEDDPTLQPGDLIATDHGMVRFQTWRKANAYTPVDRKLIETKAAKVIETKIVVSPEREQVPAARQHPTPLHRAAASPRAAAGPAAMPVSQQWW
jgi:hypothetical protein